MLSDEYLAAARGRADKFMGQWTGTAGSLAADVVRLLKEREEMAAELEQHRVKIPNDYILRGQAEIDAAKNGTPADPPLPHDHLLRDDAPEAVKLLEDAARAVASRRETYGPPIEHFSRTVALVNAAFGTTFKPADWATIMQLDKIARMLGTGYTRDNDVDSAGYAACRSECLERNH